MRVEGSRVGIVGGSIAGCATAIALRRLGCDITVLERSSGALRDRGAGIAVPDILRLRERVADEDYRDGVQVSSVTQDAGGVRVETTTGESLGFDVLVGADGYRSIVRTLVHGPSNPEGAGYILWRGNFPAAELTETTVWDEVVETGEWVSWCFDGGHAVMYPIPDFEGDGLRVNWAVYAPVPDALVVAGPSSIPPGTVEPEVFDVWVALRESFPARLRPLFAGGADVVSIQPIFDEIVDRQVLGRLVLVGDSAALTRPHTGSGATKAMQEARLLESLGATHPRWEELLAAYDADRTPAGTAIVELGRRIGRDQVEQTPPWTAMSEQDFRDWSAGTLSGDTLYFWARDGELVHR
jgi:2-polyprenyl-6-methoxyphenol hydroxylase-like FAD-dependent oxidoreductase